MYMYRIWTLLGPRKWVARRDEKSLLFNGQGRETVRTSTGSKFDSNIVDVSLGISNVDLLCPNP
jgi:hypothetical protein